MNGRDSLVSVVIPAFNAERFLARTLDSAIAQTHGNLEIIVVDDGSTDGTRSLVDSYTRADARVQRKTIPNGGVANARNAGIACASGAFVAFLDADDLWHPKKIELQISSLVDGDGARAAASYAFRRLIDVDDNVVRTPIGLACNGRVFARLIYAKFVGNGSSLLVRRDAALAVGGYEPSWAARGIGGCEDLDFELKLAARYPIAATPYYLVGYRESPGNMSSDKTRMTRALIATVDHHLDRNLDLPQWAVRAARTSTREYVFWLQLKQRDEALRHFIELLRLDATAGVALAAKMGWLATQKQLAKGIRPRAHEPDRSFASFAHDDPNDHGERTSRDERRARALLRLSAIDERSDTSAASVFADFARAR